jgi:hypothetical protein
LGFEIIVQKKKEVGKMRPSLGFKLSVILLVVMLAGVCSPTARAEERSVPADSAASDSGGVGPLKAALEDFHQVMAPLWHESLPQQDLAGVREKAPLLSEKLMTLVRVQLPAGLEKDDEKLKDFLGKRQELAIQVAQVNLAAKDGPDSSLASAFEKMHWAYEELDKVFAEPIKELDSLHETLYFLWHKTLPERDYQTIKETAPVLKAEADSLMKVPVPQRCKEKKDEFEKRRTALKDAIYQFAVKCESGSEEDIDEALKAVHETFEQLNMLL